MQNRKKKRSTECERGFIPDKTGHYPWNVRRTHPDTLGMGNQTKKNKKKTRKIKKKQNTPYHCARNTGRSTRRNHSEIHTHTHYTTLRYTTLLLVRYPFALVRLCVWFTFTFLYEFLGLVDNGMVLESVEIWDLTECSVWNLRWGRPKKKKTTKEQWHICSGTERHAPDKIALPLALPLFASSSLLCYSVSRRYSPGSGVADFLSFSDSAILWKCVVY